MPVRILVVDDHTAIRRLLRRVLQEQHPEWEVCGEAADGAEGVERFRERTRIILQWI